MWDNGAFHYTSGLGYFHVHVCLCHQKRPLQSEFQLGGSEEPRVHNPIQQPPLSTLSESCVLHHLLATWSVVLTVLCNVYLCACWSWAFMHKLSCSVLLDGLPVLATTAVSISLFQLTNTTLSACIWCRSQHPQFLTSEENGKHYKSKRFRKHCIKWARLNFHYSIEINTFTD